MNIELGEVQAAFADIIWTNEPVGSGELVKICERELKWKKPTTYTVLRKLCEKGLFKNEDGVVTSVISREEFNASKSEKFIEETFDGSLPAFIAAFISQKKLSKKEAEYDIRKCKLSIRNLCGIMAPVLIGIVLLMRKGKIMAIDNKKEQEREELYRAIWAIADELRGAVDG